MPLQLPALAVLVAGRKTASVGSFDGTFKTAVYGSCSQVHKTIEGEILVQEIISIMEEKRYADKLTEKPSVIRKQVIKEFLDKYGNTPVWNDILENIQEDAVIDRKLTRIREKVWGNLPRNRDDLDIRRVVESMPGSEDLIVMDSNELVEEDDFKEKLRSLEIVPEKNG